MHTKIRVEPSLRVGLLGLTVFSLWTGGDAGAAATGGVAAPRAALAAGASVAGAAKNRFLGAHPVVGKPATGYCYIDVPHVHDYVPDRPAVFQQVNDEYVFTGDPVPFGYDGDKTVFYGHHPVPAPLNVTTGAPPTSTFCFIKGPHYHDFPVPEAPGFKQKDNVTFYVGPIPPDVARERPQRERAVEAEYQPYAALRPQVVVVPPPEWQGVVWVPPPPSTVVVAPTSSQVVIAPPISPVVVVAPPQPSLVVVPPHPPSIVIGVPMPGVIFMGNGHGNGHGWKGGHG